MQIMAFVNNYIIPLIPAMLFARKQRERFVSPEFFFRYIVFLVCNIPLTHVAVAAIRILFQYNVKVEAALYTPLGAISAIIAYVIAHLYQAFIDLRIEADKDE